MNNASLPAGRRDLPSAPELSIVVGSISSARSIVDCLDSISKSVADCDAEVIVVDAGTDDAAAVVQNRFPHVTLVRMTPGTLTPELWAAGLAQARGEHVAFTTGHTTVHKDWSRALLSSLRPGVGGAGGPIALSVGSSVTDAAIYFLRYSAFMPRAGDSLGDVPEIAGDNAMYRGDLLRKHAGSFDDGFWEVPFHRLLRADGESLRIVPEGEAVFGRSFGLRAMSSQRFTHGQHFGRWRAASGQSSKGRIMVASPVVPILLLARIARRVLGTVGEPRDASVAMSRGRLALRFVAAAPMILWLGVCWAAGEARGAWEA